MSLLREIIIFASVAIVVVLTIGAAKTLAENNFNLPAGQSGTITGEAVKEPTAQGAPQRVQKAVLKMVNYNYVVEPNPLKKGVPVKMEVDLKSVYGCMRTVVIPAFNVIQRVREGDNIIEFTPDKSGTFQITCGMNMGRGTFQVAEDNGRVDEYTEEVKAAPIPSAGSCGAGGGGCGCSG